MLDDSSGEEMMLAIQDLWTRRGPIKHIYSDNGKNFVKCANILKEEQLRALIRDKGIQWHFNTPFNPQAGGVWERLIRDIKRAMEVVIGTKTVVGEKVFQQTLLQIEDMMNSRPLTHIPTSPDDDEPLTPNFLIKNHPGYSLVLNDAGEIDSTLTIQKSQFYASQIMRRWTREYLPIIAQHPRSRRAGPISATEGDYVLYVDPVSMPNKWPKGIVTKVYRGRDNIGRAADITLPDGRVLPRRPAFRLAKLVSSTGKKIATCKHQQNKTSTFSAENFARREKVQRKNTRQSGTINFIYRSSSNIPAVNNIANVETMKPTISKAKDLALKVYNADFMSTYEIQNEDSFLGRAFRSVLAEQSTPRATENRRTLKLANIDCEATIFDVLIFITNLGLRPTWVKCENINSPTLHVFARATSSSLCEDLSRQKFAKMNGRDVLMTMPRGERDYLREKGLEHALISWAPTDLHRSLPIIISRARDTRQRRKAMRRIPRIWRDALDEETDPPQDDERFEGEAQQEATTALSRLNLQVPAARRLRELVNGPQRRYSEDD